MAGTKQLPELSYLNECFILRDNGDLIWRSRPLSHFKSDSNRKTWLVKFEGKVAGCKCKNGYRQVAIMCNPIRNHRIVFFMYYGYQADYIDHKDRDKSNNNPLNLRDSTMSQNIANSNLRVSNLSGFKGVSRHEKKWIARIMVNRQSIRLGVYDNKGSAAAAYKRAAKSYFGDFAYPASNLNIIQKGGLHCQA